MSPLIISYLLFFFRAVDQLEMDRGARDTGSGRRRRPGHVSHAALPDSSEAERGGASADVEGGGSEAVRKSARTCSRIGLLRPDRGGHV